MKEVHDKKARRMCAAIERDMSALRTLCLEQVDALRALSARVIKPASSELAMREALQDIARLRCDCTRMRVFDEFKTTREVVIGKDKTHHWLGCHVAIAARGYGGPM